MEFVIINPNPTLGDVNVTVASDKMAVYMDSEAAEMLADLLEEAAERLAGRVDADRHMAYPVYEASEVDDITADMARAEHWAGALRGKREMRKV